MVAIPATVSMALQWQWFDGAAWHNFGDPFDLGSLVRTRRSGPGPRLSQTAQVWRLIKKAGPDWTTAVFTADAVKAFAEGPLLSAVRVRSFNFDDADQRYFHIHGYNNIDVYHADRWVASIPTPYDSAQVLRFNRTNVLDTLLTFHALTPTRRVTRQGAHNQWDARDLAFESLPVFDYTGLRAGGVDEVQQIHFKTYVNGDTFNITLEGNTTSSIIYSNVGATLAASIQSALEALPNVGVGGVVVANTSADTFSVTFAGDNRADDIGQMAPVTLSSTSGLVVAATLTEGVPGGEAIMSPTRGWPAAGTFYQGRLYVAGLLSRPQTVLGSRIGQYFKFKSQGKDTAISEDLDTQETTTILDVYAGDHLQLFTGSAEFFFPNEPIVPPSAIKKSTARGLQAGVPVFTIPAGDGGASATLFIAAGGHAACEMLFDGFRGLYSSGIISKFATHLMANPDELGRPQNQIVDMGFRRAKSSVEADRALMIRDDGVAVVMHALRDDDVTGFVRWTTQGLFLSAAADLARDEYVAVLRSIGEVNEIYIEKVSDAALLDSQASAGPGASTLSLPWLAGRTVALYMDGTDLGDVIVPNDGTVNFPGPALREVSAGLIFQPKGRTLPAIQQQDQRQGLSAQPQVGVIDLELGPTSNLKGGLPGGKMWRVPLKRQGEVVDGLGPGIDPFTGWTHLLGVPGFRTDAQFEFIQERPGPLMIKQVVLTIDS